MIDFDALMSLDIVESKSFEPLPKGLYKVSVDSCELGAVSSPPLTLPPICTV